MYLKEERQTSDNEKILLITKDALTNARNSKILSSRRSLLSLMIGIIAGLCFSQLFIFSFRQILTYFSYKGFSIDYAYEYKDRPHHQPEIDFVPHFHDFENKTISDKLLNEVSVLCLVMTDPENHSIKAEDVKNTWGRRCNKLVFMSTEEDKELGAVALPVNEGRQHLWSKTKEAFKYIYDHYLDEYDWFMKTDHNTYVVLENLRKSLYPYSREYPICLGCKVKSTIKEEDISGGTGYTLSRKAVQLFIENAVHDGSKCRQESDGDEIVELTKCLRNVDVFADDSHDEQEQLKLLPHQDGHENSHIEADLPSTTFSSNKAIFLYSGNLHHTYVIEYLIYHLRPVGIIPAPDILPDKIPLDGIMNEHSSYEKSSQFLY